MINNSTVSLALVFLTWLLFRCALTLWFFQSEYQAYLYTFVILTALLDFFVLIKASKWSQQLHEAARTSGKNSSFAFRIANGGFLLSILVPPLCASMVSIKSLSLTGNPAPFQGSVSVDQAVALPEGGCFTIPEARPYVRYLGAVEWKEDSDDGRFFYAVPLESNTWEPSQQVRIWAIVDEYELTNGALTQKKYFVNISKRNMYYETFRLAVSNAEENLDLQSSDVAFLVRLIDSPVEAQATFRGTTFWIVLSFSLIAFLIALYPFLYTRAPRIGEDITGAEANNEPQSQLTIPPTPAYKPRSFAATRRFWFMLHVVGFIPLAVSLVSTRSILLTIVLVVVLPLLELWLLMHAFSHPQVRQSLRLALGLLMPVAMMFAMILVVVCIFRHLEYARYDPQVILTNLDSMPWDDKTVQVSEELKMRRQLTGSFWAPNAQTKAWRMIPLLKDGWQADIPIELWVKSTDRLDSILAEQPLKFAKVTSQVDDFRLLQAIANAESRYGVKSAEAVLVLEPVADPDKQLDEGNGFALIGFTLCLLSWSVCSLFWPRNPQPASSSE